MKKNKWIVSQFSIDPEELGKKRNKIHQQYKNSTRRFFKDKNIEDVIGAYGEVAFGDLFDLPVDIDIRPHGDKSDFITNIGKIDVKTARKAYNLLVKKYEIGKSDIYVLAQFNEANKSVNFLGWETDEVMRNQPLRDFGYGIINYYKSCDKLKRMDDLEKLLKET